MLIKGLQKTTLLDYPGKLACTIFVSGCNFRCPFCQNKDLVLPELTKKLKTYSEKEILEFLKSRKGKLEAVCITGGEPTLYSDVPIYLRKVKELGYLIKLDTNGTNPEMVEKLINEKLIDYVAMDLKGPMEKYFQYFSKNSIFNNQIPNNIKVQNSQIISKIRRTIGILLKSGIEFELRTTVVPILHLQEDIIQMVRDIENLVIENSLKIVNCKLKIKWYLQQFRPKNCLDPKFDKIKPYEREWFEKVLREIKVYLPKTKVRGL